MKTEEQTGELPAGTAHRPDERDPAGHERICPSPSLSLRERIAAGKELRKVVPRSQHARWAIGGDGRDPVGLLEDCNQGRLPRLVPIRYGRMARDPFAFLRGSPAVMAHDLAGMPATGLPVQACGDCHLANFGLFATPERNLIFDLNDFDETLPASWECDLKRLTASFVVASRVNGISDRRAEEIAAAAARAYRERLRELCHMSPLSIWSLKVTADDLIAAAPDGKSRALRQRMADRARARTGDQVLPKITTVADGSHRFVEQPPVVTRADAEDAASIVGAGIERYRASLADDRRRLFDRYRLEDFALRVVGIGSVATRCYVGLWFCDDRNPLLLQVKEARRSVLERCAHASAYENQGRRVVEGQRLLQAASDQFLGWFRSDAGHDFYVRQFRDMKYSVPIDKLSATQMERYASVCGQSLARAHAKSADPARISGYLGAGDSCDVALARFALLYADQVERDHAALVAAGRIGRVTLESESDSAAAS